MEHWRFAVTGYGAAYLYLTSLEVPEVADQVREALAEVLNTPSGRYAQLVAVALILRNLTRLPDPGRLAARLHAELRDAPADALVPAWLADSLRAGWGTDLAGRLIGETILIRPETAYG
jgi:hypothetical protein